MRSDSFGARDAITAKERLSRAGERADVMSAVLSRRRFVVLSASSAMAAWPKWAHAEGAFIQDVAWSPDGTRIAFRSNRDGANELYLMQPDGTDIHRLTSGGAPNSFPSWSPTGSIAFSSKRTGTWQIFAIVPGKTPLQITNNAWDNENPIYSPDGQLIAFQSNRRGRDAIYVISTDGSSERVVSGRERFCVFPAWRTNGILTFSSSANADSPADSVDAVNLDTGAVSKLPIKAGFFVRWERSGRQAAIISGTYPQTNLFRCNLDGTNLVEIA
jgi:Tol biopolymer transport system component